MLEYLKLVSNLKNKLDLNKENPQIKKILERHVYNGLVSDFNKYDRDSLMEKYTEYFRGKEIRCRSIKEGEIYYRGRRGCKYIKLMDDDCSFEGIMPFYGKDISAVPNILTKGGRFNRSGVSYLYLSTNIETCLAEVGTLVGESCSIGEFRALKNVDFLDLSSFSDETILTLFLSILSMPHTEIHPHVYTITQFLSDVFRNINGNGIYFQSTQTGGGNIVVFKPEYFKHVDYTESVYSIKSIRYEYEMDGEFVTTMKRYKKGTVYSKYDENECDTEYIDKLVEKVNI